MINSRSIKDLHPYVKTKAQEFIQACADQGVFILITSTYRDNESQNALYAQGRTTPGKIVTNAKGGNSFHQYKVALDFVPLRDGKAVWGTTGEDGKLWKKAIEIAKSVGFESASEWKTFKELPHLQITLGLTLADLKAGKTIDSLIR